MLLRMARPAGYAIVLDAELPALSVRLWDYLKRVGCSREFQLPTHCKSGDVAQELIHSGLGDMPVQASG